VPRRGRAPDEPTSWRLRKRALPALEAGERSIRRAIERLDVAVVEPDPALLTNVNTPDDLQQLDQRGR
jgi:molybdopterin-guanine dinucleotide biosynthesis protein A